MIPRTTTRLPRTLRENIPAKHVLPGDIVILHGSKAVKVWDVRYKDHPILGMRIVLVVTTTADGNGDLWVGGPDTEIVLVNR